MPAYYFHRLRKVIALKLEARLFSPMTVELDERYFGGKRKGKNGRGAAGVI
jgi:transposase